MRIRFAFEVMFRREPKPVSEEPQFEHRDNDGTMVVHVDQPKYIGFTREEQDTDRDARGTWDATEVKTAEELRRMQDGGAPHAASGRT